MKLNRMSKYVACAAAGLVVTAVTSVPAHADDFIPENGPPTVAAVMWPGPITPTKFGEFNPFEYRARATVGSSAGVDNLSSVSLCLYAPGSDNECADALGSPQTQFKMTWTPGGGPEGSFAITGEGTNHYVRGFSWAMDNFPGALEVQLDFGFQVSDAMRASTGWKGVFTATDNQGNITKNTTDMGSGDLTVNYYGSVTMDRNITFGTIAEGDSSVVSNITDGTFVANGESDVTVQATDFQYNGNWLTVSSDPGLAPASHSVFLDCVAGSDFAVGTPVRVSTAGPQTLQGGVFTGGTGEAGDATLTNSCQLTYGGGATVANHTYTNAVTVGVGAV